MSREIVIDGKWINDDSDAWVIAELGHNHGGSLDTARSMVHAAGQAGADAVKLQKRDNKTLYTEEAYSRPYESESSYGSTYGLHREALEFGQLEYASLDAEAYEAGVTFFATPFDQKSADFLAVSTKCPVFKIASADLTNLTLIRHVAQYRRPLILSTGAGSIYDVDAAVEATRGLCDVVLMQCTAEYPCRVEHLNLKVIQTYRDRYPEFVIGLSSHYSGISDAIAAYVLGARIFEKHFTLDRTSKGSDHAFSLEPQGLAKIVGYLRKVRLMLGSGSKELLPEEQQMIAKMRETTRWYTEGKHATA